MTDGVSDPLGDRRGVRFGAHRAADSGAHRAGRSPRVKAARWLGAAVIILIAAQSSALATANSTTGVIDPSAAVGGPCPVLPETAAAPAPPLGGIFAGVQLNALQVTGASTIVSVGRRMHIGTRGIRIAIAVAMQESSLNSEAVVEDYVGLFNQKADPTSGLYTNGTRRNPDDASRMFFEQLTKRVPEYQTDGRSDWQIGEVVQETNEGRNVEQWFGLSNALAAKLGAAPAITLGTAASVGATAAKRPTTVPVAAVRRPSRPAMAPALRAEGAAFRPAVTTLAVSAPTGTELQQTGSGSTLSLSSLTAPPSSSPPNILPPAPAAIVQSVASTVQSSAVPPNVATVPVATVPVATVPVATVPVATVPVAGVPTVVVPTAVVPVATVPVATVPTAAVPTAVVPTAVVPTAVVPTAVTAPSTAQAGVPSRAATTAAPGTRTSGSVTPGTGASDPGAWFTQGSTPAGPTIVSSTTAATAAPGPSTSVADTPGTGASDPGAWFTQGSTPAGSTTAPVTTSTPTTSTSAPVATTVTTTTATTTTATTTTAATTTAAATTAAPTTAAATTTAAPTTAAEPAPVIAPSGPPVSPDPPEQPIPTGSGDDPMSGPDPVVAPVTTDAGATGDPAPLDCTPSSGGRSTSFDPGSIVSDAVFYNSRSMTTAQLRKFIDEKGAACTLQSCLRLLQLSTPDRPADRYCAAYPGGIAEDVASVLAKLSVACGINPQVMLVTLQKESALLTRSDPAPASYAAAYGWHCPDSGPGGSANCDPQYAGFFNQAYGMAKQWARYRLDPQKYNFHAGQTVKIGWNVAESGCGGSTVLIRNTATASLYNYTPYQPNAAALAGYPGVGDKCSAYGNRNFFFLFQKYFGVTGGGADAAVTLNGVNVTVPINVNVAPGAVGQVVRAPNAAVAKGIAAGFASIGLPYVWGGGTDGSGPDQGCSRAGGASNSCQGIVGFDCSGLTAYVLRQAGYGIATYSGAQRSGGISVPWSQGLPGDIIGYNGHVAVYLGFINGIRYLMEAPDVGKFVQVRPVYYANGGVAVDPVLHRYWK